MYNTGAAVESSLASSGVCDSPSILAVCWNTTWGWRWDLSTSGRSLNALFYLHYLSPSEARKISERGRTDLIPPSSTQTEKCIDKVWRVYVEEETFSTFRQHTTYSVVFMIVYLEKIYQISLKCLCFLCCFQLHTHCLVYRIEALFFLLTFCTFCFFPVVCRWNAQH